MPYKVIKEALLDGHAATGKTRLIVGRVEFAGAVKLQLTPASKTHHSSCILLPLSKKISYLRG